jgi:CelD/BcsL family acetyltransferase involved in cellulose biosynthesis
MENNQVNYDLKVRRISKDSDFSSLEKTWNQLLEQSSNTNPFLTWEWLYTWWSFYKEGKELCILLIKNNEEILGIAPLYLRKENFIAVPVRILRLMGDEEVCSEYLSVIARKDVEEEIYSFLLEYIMKNNDEWDAIHFTDVLSGSKFELEIENLRKDSGM